MMDLDERLLDKLRLNEDLWELVSESEEQKQKVYSLIKGGADPDDIKYFVMDGVKYPYVDDEGMSYRW